MLVLADLAFPLFIALIVLGSLKGLYGYSVLSFPREFLQSVVYYRIVLGIHQMHEERSSDELVFN